MGVILIHFGTINSLKINKYLQIFIPSRYNLSTLLVNNKSVIIHSQQKVNDALPRSLPKYKNS
jgi:hypothetical protein